MARSTALLLLTAASLATACSPGTVESDMPPNRPSEDMVTLTVHLHEGFDDDTVILSVNGEEVIRKEHVSYSPLLGYADVSFERQVDPGPVKLRVHLPERDQSASIELELDGDTYLGVSVVGGEIQFTPPSVEPFGYG